MLFSKIRNIRFTSSVRLSRQAPSVLEPSRILPGSTAIPRPPLVLDGCFAHPEYETWELTVPLSLQLDLGLDASMHLSLRSAKLWQTQQHYKLLHTTNYLNGISLQDFHEHRAFLVCIIIPPFLETDADFAQTVPLQLNLCL